MLNRKDNAGNPLSNEPSAFAVGIETIVSQPDENFTEFRKMYLLYLQKLEKLTDKERACFTDYFNFVNKPAYIINAEKAD